MKDSNMTALVSLFSRAFHSEKNVVPVFCDPVARKMLTDEEYSKIAKTFAAGIKFFNPNFEGTEKQALRYIVDNQLSPSVLGRAAFCEKALANAVKTGTRQYVILGAGYDSFAYRESEERDKLEIFELDREKEQQEKLARIHRANIKVKSNVHYISADFSLDDWEKPLLECSSFKKDKMSFCSLLGVTYYLKSDDFEKLLATLSKFLVKGSTLVFDYPDEKSFSSNAAARTQKQTALAKGSSEEMISGWSFAFMEHLLANYDFLCYEHLTPKEITDTIFAEYNSANPKNRISALENVNYCLAVKK